METITIALAVVTGIALGAILSRNQKTEAARTPVSKQKNRRRRYSQEEDLKIMRVRTSSGIQRLSRELKVSPHAIKQRRHKLRKRGYDVKTMKIGRPPVILP